jgi:YD repeat-containing protein
MPNTNGIGHLTAMSDLSGTTSWIYDQHGRVLTKRQTAGSLTLTTAMSYDTAGRLAGITYPSGTIVRGRRTAARDRFAAGGHLLSPEPNYWERSPGP